MGWTSVTAKNYYKNGTVNRKAECDEHFKKYPDDYEVIRSTLYGSYYYAAIRMLRQETQPVVGVVALTKAKTTAKYNFCFKLISEDMEPADTRCPDVILNLLSETDSVSANRWREACREYNRKKRILDEYHMGTRIVITYEGKTYILTKSVLRGHSTPQWICWSNRIKFKIEDIIQLGFEKYCPSAESEQNNDQGPKIITPAFLQEHYKEIQKGKSV